MPPCPRSRESFLPRNRKKIISVPFQAISQSPLSSIQKKKKTVKILKIQKFASLLSPHLPFSADRRIITKGDICGAVPWCRCKQTPAVSSRNAGGPILAAARSRHGSDNRTGLSFTTVSPLRYLPYRQKINAYPL